jgi:hypothetical protein
MRKSLHQIGELALDNIVQGHGSVLLRGEIPEALETSHKYLDTIEEKVQEALDGGQPKSVLRALDVEQCHKSRIPLNGMVEALHQNNLSHLYDALSAGEQPETRVSREETLDKRPSS